MVGHIKEKGQRASMASAAGTPGILTCLTATFHVLWRLGYVYQNLHHDHWYPTSNPWKAWGVGLKAPTLYRNLSLIRKSIVWMRTVPSPPPRLLCLNMWSTVGGIVREGLGGVALRERQCITGVDFKVSKDPSHSQCPSLCLGVGSQGVSSPLLLQSHACLPDAMIPAVVMD